MRSLTGDEDERNGDRRTQEAEKKYTHTKNWSFYKKLQLGPNLIFS